jgi:hypothetical protein
MSETDAPELEAPTQEEAPSTPEVEGDAPPNAVLIVRVEDEQGNVSTDAVPLGDVKPTEVQTIIELGLANWRAKLGLNG